MNFVINLVCGTFPLVIRSNKIFAKSSVFEPDDLL